MIAEFTDEEMEAFELIMGDSSKIREVHGDEKDEL
jgi:hypothetical protein